MNRQGGARVDVAAVRAAHPLPDVVAAAGVELRPQGRGFVGCCPFHDDSTPSLSVDGVPDRYTCFGCGAHGDVIDFVQRLRGVSFVEAVAALESGPLGSAAPVVRHVAAPPDHPTPRPVEVSRGRVHDINEQAWRVFSAPAPAAYAESYLTRRRGLDVTALRAIGGGAPVAGYAAPGWTSLTNRLLRQGVTPVELVVADVSRRSRTGRLVDTFRGRVVLPVRGADDRIHGFIGRDVTGEPGTPKYLNPTRTPVFDKGTVLYRPTHHRLSHDANVVVVEGALDALAVAAAAATAGQMKRFAPCSTSGTACTDAQARAVAGLHPTPPVIALDPDAAGTEGTLRWVHALSVGQQRAALIARLPDGHDPLEHVAAHGMYALAVFDRVLAGHRGGPTTSGTELVRAVAARHANPAPALSALLPRLLDDLPPWVAEQYHAGAVAEATRLGWNTGHAFERLLRPQPAGAAAPAVHRIPAGDSLTLR